MGKMTKLIIDVVRVVAYYSLVMFSLVSAPLMRFEQHLTLSS